MELLVITIVYLSTEPFRRACLRATPSPHVLGRIWSLSLFAIPIGLVMSVLSYYAYAHFVVQKAEQQALLYTSLWHYGTYIVCFDSFCIVLAANLEMLAEPMYIVTQNLLLYKVRLRIEGVALVAKVAVTVLLIPMLQWYTEEVQYTLTLTR